MRRAAPLILAAAMLAPACAHRAKFAGEPADPTDDVRMVQRPKADPADPLPGLLRTTVLHYAFDDASLSPTSQTQLAKVATVLRRQPWSAIQVSGHCDERGTEEYNLVLGQRRADTARAYLVALGANDDQVTSVTYGDMIPAVPGQDEEAFAWNRRAEFSAEPLELYGYVGPMELP